MQASMSAESMQCCGALQIIISWFPMTPCEMYYKLIVPHWATRHVTSVLILLRWGHLSMSHHIIARRSSCRSRRARASRTTFYCWEQRVLLHAISIMTSGRWASGIANLLTWFAYKDQHGYSNSLVLQCSVALQYEYARGRRALATTMCCDMT
jgi:hypothetical protein